MKQFLIDWIEANSKQFNDAADYLWQNPELGMEEKKILGKANRTARALRLFGGKKV